MFVLKLFLHCSISDGLTVKCHPHWAAKRERAGSGEVVPAGWHQIEPAANNHIIPSRLPAARRNSEVISDTVLDYKEFALTCIMQHKKPLKNHYTNDHSSAGTISLSQLRLLHSPGVTEHTRTQHSMRRSVPRVLWMIKPFTANADIIFIISTCKDDQAGSNTVQQQMTLYKYVTWIKLHHLRGENSK